MSLKDQVNIANT